MYQNNSLTFANIKTINGELDTEFLGWLSKKLDLDVFIETGTYRGDTVASVSTVFETVHSIELSESLYQQARQRFSGQSNIFLHQGDSGQVLQRLLPQVGGRFLLWLDAHYSEGETARGDENTPVLTELEALKATGRQDAVILIDDLRLFQAPVISVSDASSVGGYPSLLAVYEKILEINPDYQLYVLGDVVTVIPGPADILPSPVVQACTLSRVYDGECIPVSDVLHAEMIIANAENSEKKFIESLPELFAASEPYGLCNYFHLWKGLIRQSDGQHREACEAFQCAVEQGLDHWRVYWYLAQAAEKSGRHELAIQALQKADLSTQESVQQTINPAAVSGENTCPGNPPVENAFLQDLMEKRLWKTGQPIKLHLGCGEQHLDGYINIDFPVDEHNIMNVQADIFADFTRLDLPEGSIDEIRSHHAFEHFGRVAALALLIKWQKSLKPGGRLHLETPDIEGSARMLTSQAPWQHKMAALRHLAGDQAAAWAYHLDLWSGERFDRTLTTLGFSAIEVDSWCWRHEPHLSNVEVVAVKATNLTDNELLAVAANLLEESLVSPAEQPLLEVWKSQLVEALTGNYPGPGQAIPAVGQSARPLPSLPDWAETDLTLPELYDANQRNRDTWMAAKAAEIPAGSLVLDMGAGTCPYRNLFSHCDYKTHDFKQYEGVKLGGGSEYGAIDYVSDIASLPVPDAMFDVVICTEVLEHVTEPIEALREMSRVLKQGGRLLITAPLGSGLHQLPYHYYGGYTPEWYKHFGKQFGLDMQSIEPNGGFFRLLAQECARVSWTLPQHAHLHGENTAFIQQLFGEWLPRFLYGLDSHSRNEQFTIGYHVDAVKVAPSWRSLLDESDSEQADLAGNAAESFPQNNNAALTNKTIGLFFSKDRPMQLEAALASFYAHVTDADNLETAVIYTASSPAIADLYIQLENEFPGVKFVREKSFKQDVLEQLADATHVLFSVDDSVYVQDFSLEQSVQVLDQNPQAIGVSLRLGSNTRYCYTLDRTQALPEFDTLSAGYYRYRWPGSEHDFGYPLEVSSSLYRVDILSKQLRELDYSNPNTLEAALAGQSPVFRDKYPELICFSQSVAFSNPVNRVQSVCNNRAGISVSYSSEELAWRFSTGERIEINKLDGFIPEACHQETEYTFVRRNQPNQAVKKPLVSVIIPCYNQANYLAEAVQSVVDQRFKNWECIIVDDGSPDNTVEVAGQIINHFNSCNISLIQKDNAGLAGARNTGITEAKGKYILPLDADDKLHPDFLAETVTVLESNPEAAIVYVDEQNFGVSQHVHCKGDSNLETLKRANVHDYCSLYRREVWETSGGYSSAMYLGGEDWNFWLTASKLGFRSIHLAKPLFLYRNRDNTMVSVTLANLDEVRAHVILHNPELFSKSEVVAAEQKMARLPPANLERLRVTQAKNPADRMLACFLELATANQTGIAPLFGELPENPLVSVIVPTYNRPELLKDALQSLIDQSYLNWEALVVNDAGEDVGNWVRTIDSRIHYIEHPQNAGLSAARNTAVAASKGEILCYLDDDDLFLPNHLQTVVNALKSTNAGFVYTEAEYINEKLHGQSRVELGRSRPYENIHYSKDRLHVGNYIPVNCWAHRRELIQEAGAFDTSLTALEDWDMLLRFSRLSAFIHIPEVTVEVHVRPSDEADQMTSRTMSNNVSNYKNIYSRYAVDFNPGLQIERDKMLARLGGKSSIEKIDIACGDMYTADYAYSLDEARAMLMAERMVTQWEKRPAIHLLTVVQSGDEKYLADTLDCLDKQLYAGWGLTVISNLPEPDETFTRIDQLEWIDIGNNRLCDVLNKSIRETAADWVAFIDAGDKLEPHLLYACSDSINRHADWRLIYVDHDVYNAGNRQCDTYFKPDYNADMFLSMPYMGPFYLFERNALVEAGGYGNAPGVENYGLALRLLENHDAGSIGHIDEILYHQLPANQAQYSQEQVYENGRIVLEKHLSRLNTPANVGHGLLPGSYFVDYQHASQPMVSIIVPTRDRLDLLKPCIDSVLEKTRYQNYEIIIVDNNSIDFDTLAYMEKIEYAYNNVSLIRYPHEYNFSAINNMAVAAARGEYIILLNNDTQVVQPNWLDRMLAHGQRSEIGIVGCRLVFPSQRIQHAGVVLGFGAADHIHIGLEMDDPGYMGRNQIVQNFSAVTAACMLLRKSVYNEVGGLDEDVFKILFNDVDLCLKVVEAGYRIVWTPYATLVHQGSGSIRHRQSGGSQVKKHNEAYHMFEKWLPRIANDPAYNRNLSLVDRKPTPELEILPGWERASHDRLRILGFPFDNWGCGEYRVKSPLRTLARQTVAQTAVVPIPEVGRLPEIPELERLAPDTLLLQSFAHDKQLAYLELYRNIFPDVFMVFDLDDLKTEMPVKNPYANRMYKDIRQRLRKALSLCDRMVVSTEPLKDAYSKLSSDIIVVPNYLESERWTGLVSKRRQGLKPRVGWAGAQQHQGDLEIIIQAVKTLKDEVDWVFFGMCPDEIKPYIKEFHAGVVFSRYPEKLASLNLDLAVAPLEHNRFNEAKSNLRLLEYGVLGWPVIATDIHPYQNAPVTHVKNNTRAWIEAIRNHVNDLDAASVQGNKLHDWVVGNWLLENHLDDWMRVLTPESYLRQKRPRTSLAGVG